MDVDNQTFQDRKKLLFASLESAEKSINKESILSQKDVDFNKDNILFVKPRVVPFRKGVKQDALRFRGKESIFKREEQPIEKCLKPRNVPQFKSNPKKWIKYSLEDADMSDMANTAAAFNFLREIESRKQLAIEDVPLNEKPNISKPEFKKSKLMFNRSVGLRSKITETEGLNDKIIQGAKIIMPEYVVGQKRRKEKKQSETKSTATSSVGALRLDHLLDECDELE